jgi:hypothetical protein
MPGRVIKMPRPLKIATVPVLYCTKLDSDVMDFSNFLIMVHKQYSILINVNDYGGGGIVRICIHFFSDPDPAFFSMQIPGVDEPK